MRKLPFDRIAFVVSVAFLAFLYGIATQAFGWFPSPQLARAWDQARSVVPLGGSEEPTWVVPRVFDREGVRVVDFERIQPGLTLIGANFTEFGSKPGLKLIDREGRVLHSWRVRPEEIFPESANRRGRELEHAILNGSYLFENGDVLVNVDYVGTVRLDACGRVLWRVGSGNHHSIARAEDGSFWIPAVTPMGPAKSEMYPEGFPGLERSIYQDLILHVSEDGEILETFNVLDILYSSGLQRHISKASWKGVTDALHLNDVEPLPSSIAADYPLFRSGDLVVSLRFLDLVFVFDPRSNEVKWHASHPFRQQHDPDFLGNGWIGVFDNQTDLTDRGTMLGGSRVVAVQPHTDSLEILFPTDQSDQPEGFYTASIGEWQQLQNGNLLLTESQAGRVIEVDPSGRIVWEWVVSPYSESKVPEVPDASRYPLSPRQVESWPCSARVSTRNEEEVTP